MPRKAVVRSLPELRALFPEFRGFAATDNKTTLVADRLRTTVERVRQDGPIPFYSMRAVAQFFGVALKTVVDTYEKLEAEGLLTRVRGSQTFVQSRRLQPRHPVRGVVGVPIYLPALITGREWRELMIALEGELRRYHFVPDFIFYRADEQVSDDLTERLLEHELDMVFWFCPSAANIPTMQRLLDGGIRLVVVSDGKGQFPREQYYLNLERALMEAMTDWQQAGIESATVLHSPTHPSKHAHQLMTSVLRQARLPFAIQPMADAETPRRVRELCRRKRHGVILLSHVWYEELCMQFPRDMERLFCERRVFITQGAMYHPGFRDKKVPVDTISVPNLEIARRVAHDMSTQHTEAPRRLVTFHTRYHARINLGDVTRGL